MNPFFRLVRWPNLLMLAVMMVVSALFLVGPKDQWLPLLTDPKFLAMVFGTVFIAAAGYIINDYFDVKIDLINKPQSVIIGKSIRRQHALLLHQMLNFTGLGLSFYSDFKIGLVSLLAVSSLWFYSSLFKRKAIIGNVIVAALTATSVLLIYLFFRTNAKIILVYAIFCFLVSVIREIIKDIEDLKGDAKYGCQTLPIIWGTRPTKNFVFVLILLFLAYLVFLVLEFPLYRVRLVFAGLGFPMIYLAYALYWADKKTDYHRLSKICKYIMMVGIATMFLF